MRRSQLVRFTGVCVLAGCSLLVGFASSARAATDALYASPTGSGDCSSPANACSIATAVSDANAAPVGDAVRIELAGGTYAIGATLAVTFAGPSVTFEPQSGLPILDGGGSVQVMTVASGSTVIVDGLEITSGTASLGGGIRNDGTLTVAYSLVSANDAGNGGGISNSSGATLTVSNSTFSDNTTSSVGGGGILNFGSALIERSTIMNNTAPINGGGVNTQPSGTTTIAESTIYGNTSGSLGGGLSSLGTLTVEGSTIVGNTGSAGSAVATGSTATFAATIIARNTGDDCSPVGAAFTDAGYNLDDDGTCISSSSPAAGSHNGQDAYGSSTYGAVLDAYLAGAPASNGGPTETIALMKKPSPSTTLADPAHTVVPASFNLPAAVDGVTAACSVPDQRGVLPSTEIKCDIGAYYLSTLPQSETHAGYCSVAGNTLADGTPIPPGTFLNLVAGQPGYDSHYRGAVPANFLEGIGITCDVLPGYTATGETVGSLGRGDPGIYPYYAKTG